MRVKTGFRVGDNVTYRTPSGMVPAKIVKVNDVIDGDYSEQYEIRVSSSRYGVYVKGQTFTTGGNFLNKRGSSNRTVTPKQERRKRENKELQALNELAQRIK